MTAAPEPIYRPLRCGSCGSPINLATGECRCSD